MVDTTLLDPNLPPDVFAAVQEAQRREKIAQALLQQGAQQPQGRMVGRFYVPPSPLQGAAAMANTFAGTIGQNRAMEARKEAAEQYRSGVTDALTQYMNTKNGTQADTLPEGTEGPVRPAMAADPKKAVMEAMVSQYPQLRQIGALDYAAMQKLNQPHVLAKGAVLIGPDGKKIAENTAPSPGDVPMSVREWEYYKRLPPDQQKAYLDMKRAPQFLDLGNGFLPRPTNFPGAPAGTPAPAAVSPAAAAPAAVGTSAPLTVSQAVNGVIPKGLPPQDTAQHKADVKTAETTATAEAKRDFNMMDLGSIIDSAKSVLAGGPKGTDTKPTHSGVGSLVDKAASFVGVAPEGAKEADQLRAISGALVAKMPRMEGPQSDFDVQNYKDMAGQVGNDTLPIERRLSALKAVEAIWRKYDKNAPAVAPAAPTTTAPTVDDLLKKYGQ